MGSAQDGKSVRRMLPQKCQRYHTRLARATGASRITTVTAFRIGESSTVAHACHCQSIHPTLAAPLNIFFERDEIRQPLRGTIGENSSNDERMHFTGKFIDDTNIVWPSSVCILPV